MFTADSRTENFLTSIGVKWKYSNACAFAELASSWLNQNLGRSQVRVDGAIKEYGALMERGSAAPAPIVWQNPETRALEVLDGTQRLAAAEARGSSTFSAYLIETDSESMIRRIRVFANYRLQGGYQESAEWTLERAVTLLVLTGDMTVEECAEFGGWPPSQVRDKAQVVSFRVAIHGVGGPERLPDSVVRLVATHSAKDDFEAAPVAIARFTNAIQKMRLSAAEAEPYIEDFFSVARSRGKLFSQFEEKLQEFLESDEVEARLADPSRARYQPMTPDGRVLKALKAALTTATRVRDCGEPIYEMAEYFQVVNQIRTVLQQIERMSKKA